ncbi:MAG: PDZ domain-containing protein, partial [Nitrospinota bacterium]
ELKAYGLTVQEITPELKPHFAEARVGSILITDVKQGSPAERDGLRRGDVVLHVNDLRVRGLKGFLRSLRTAGDRELPVRLSVSRGDRRLNLMLSRKKR